MSSCVELLSGKAWFVRDGHFEDADAVLFTHVASNLGTSWGNPTGTGWNFRREHLDPAQRSIR